MNRTEIHALADQARTNPKVARGAFRKLAMENGYKGASGGWIYLNDATKATVQGWQGLADLVCYGQVTFTATEAEAGLEDSTARRAVLTIPQDRTGVSDVQASIADEVAALRDVIDSIGRITDSLARHLAVQHLDRIAALVPQRATDNAGPFWLHVCGGIGCGDIGPNGLWCERCDSLSDRGWQALYTVAGR